MDDDLKQLEAELKSLRPRMPSPRLEARIETGLGRRRRLAWSWVVLPLAAALALSFALRRPRSPMEPARPPASPVRPAAADVFKPVAMENLLVTAHDDGLVTLADGSEARRVRQSYVDTVVWRNPRTNASLTWSVPRDEVRVTPVAFQ